MMAVRDAAREAREHARTKGPILIVLNTYRIMGHSKSDSGAYRRKEEVEEWKKKDPIKRFASFLAGAGALLRGGALLPGHRGAGSHRTRGSVRGVEP